MEGQESISPQGWMSQHFFSICLNLKEAGPNASEGMDLPATEQTGKERNPPFRISFI